MFSPSLESPTLCMCRTGCHETKNSGILWLMIKIWVLTMTSARLVIAINPAHSTNVNCVLFVCLKNLKISLKMQPLNINLAGIQRESFQLLHELAPVFMTPFNRIGSKENVNTTLHGVFNFHFTLSPFHGYSLLFHLLFLHRSSCPFNFICFRNKILHFLFILWCVTFITLVHTIDKHTSIHLCVDHTHAGVDVTRSSDCRGLARRTFFQRHSPPSELSVSRCVGECVSRLFISLPLSATRPPAEREDIVDDTLLREISMVICFNMTHMLSMQVDSLHTVTDSRSIILFYGIFFFTSSFLILFSPLPLSIQFIQIEHADPGASLTSLYSFSTSSCSRARLPLVLLVFPHGLLCLCLLCFAFACELLMSFLTSTSQKTGDLWILIKLHLQVCPCHRMLCACWIIRLVD